MGPLALLTSTPVSSSHSWHLAEEPTTLAFTLEVDALKLILFVSLLFSIFVFPRDDDDDVVVVILKFYKHNTYIHMNVMNLGKQLILFRANTSIYVLRVLYCVVCSSSVCPVFANISLSLVP